MRESGAEIEKHFTAVQVLQREAALHARKDASWCSLSIAHQQQRAGQPSTNFMSQSYLKCGAEAETRPCLGRNSLPLPLQLIGMHTRELSYTSWFHVGSHQVPPSVCADKPRYLVILRQLERQ